MDKSMDSEDGFSSEKRVHSPAFFQIYSARHNSINLRIPPPFIKNFKGNIPEKISLQNIYGRVWPAKLSYINNKLHITHGWNRYVREHRMKCGEFLVFRYQQDSSFLVMAYGHDAMFKREPGEKKPSQKPIGGDEGRDPDVRANEVESMVFTKTFKNKFKNAVGVPKHIVAACSITLPQPIKLTNAQGKGVTTELRKGLDRVILGYAGLPHFWRKNKVKEGDTLEFEVILGDERKIEKVIMRNKKPSTVLGRAY